MGPKVFQTRHWWQASSPNRPRMYQRLLYTRISGRSVLSRESWGESCQQREVRQSSYLDWDMMDPFTAPIDNILFLLLIIVFIYKDHDAYSIQKSSLNYCLTINTYDWNSIIHFKLCKCLDWGLFVLFVHIQSCHQISNSCLDHNVTDKKLQYSSSRTVNKCLNNSSFREKRFTVWQS